MALSRARRDSGMNYWPGFVDALSTLVLSVIFLLTIFMVAQFFLSQDLGPGALPPGVAAAFAQLQQNVGDGTSNRATAAAMANLAEAIQGLVQHMRDEQQMIRNWADEQAKLNKDLRRFMERTTREPAER